MIRKRKLNAMAKNFPIMPLTDLAEQLRYDLDLLTSGVEAGEWDAGDTRHLYRVYDTHEFVQESQR